MMAPAILHGLLRTSCKYALTSAATSLSRRVQKCPLLKPQYPPATNLSRILKALARVADRPHSPKGISGPLKRPPIPRSPVSAPSRHGARSAQLRQVNPFPSLPYRACAWLVVIMTTSTRHALLQPQIQTQEFQSTLRTASASSANFYSL